MNYKKFTLKNGLRVIIVPTRGVRSATTMLLVGAGSRFETRKNNGISHFLEHMAFKGTKKRPSALTISTIIDGIGAEQNAFTGKEFTGFYIKSSSNHIDLSFDILSDMLTNSLLDQDEINRERGVILEEINLYEDTPYRKIGDIFEYLLYGDSPMGWDIAGEKDVIRKIQRKDFIDYMKSLYNAGNMILVVAGNFDVLKVRREIRKCFSTLPKRGKKGFEKVSKSNDKPQVLLKHKKTEQAHFALGVRTSGINNEKEKYPLLVLSAILGGGMSSRLFHEVRERRGLAYYVRTIAESYMDSGYLATFAGVDSKRIDQAISVVVEEYKKILCDGEITEQELRKAIEYTKGHFVLELEDTKFIASFYGASELLEGKIEEPEETIKAIRGVTLKDIHKVAKKYLKPEFLNLAVIGDFTDKKHFEGLLV